jgi:hypothetical protein
MTRSTSSASKNPARSSRPGLLAALPWLLAAWLAMILTKFGNPVILTGQVSPPQNFLEFLLAPWPLGWGYALVIVLVLVCLRTVDQWKFPVPRWTLVLLLVWLGWTTFSSALSVSKPLSGATVPHFLAAAACFFAGLILAGRLPNVKPIWLGLLVSLLFVFWHGLDQHFGGLEQTRQEFLNMDWSKYSPEAKAMANTPEFRRKIMSDRIFATFVYPNALAGGILLFLPICLRGIWELFGWLQVFSRLFIMSLVGMAGLACLYLSGSKAGWLIALVLGAIAFLLGGFSRKLKLAAMVLLLLAGLCGFFYKYSTYFAKGATSATARFDYWKIALQTANDKPIFGSGPGTFSVEYKNRKPPGAEMARLAHNDYLEQASDSGWVAFLAFAGFVWGSVIFVFRQRLTDWRQKAMWLGVTGLALQSCVEFGLYIPALAWPFFLFLGWLWGSAPQPVTTPATPAYQPKAVDNRQRGA